MENVFIESPVHRTQLFLALDRVTKRADESSQDTLTALPDVSVPMAAKHPAIPPWESRGLFLARFRTHLRLGGLPVILGSATQS